VDVPLEPAQGGRLGGHGRGLLGLGGVAGGLGFGDLLAQLVDPAEQATGEERLE
jgi:hypothetical protein